MEPIDANEYLIQFLGSIDNLPSEIHYHFSELSNKDQEIERLMERIERRKKRLWNLYDDRPIDEDSDCSVVESIYEDDDGVEESNSDDDHCFDDDQDGEQIIKKRRRVTRVVTEFEDEEMLKEKIIKDYVRASQLQDEKIELAERAFALVERHIKRLDEDFESLFPQHNLRDSSASTPASPSRIESSAFAAAQGIVHSSASVLTNSTVRNTAHSASTHTLAQAASSNFPNTTYEYNKGSYYPSSSAESEEVQFSLPMLPNPSSSLPRANKASASGANNGRRRKLSNVQGITNSNTEIATSAINNNYLSRGIHKLREEQLPGSSSIADPNVMSNANLLDQDDSAVSYDNTLVLSNYIPTVDPNEPLYCTCRQVSFGEMIGCDGENCPFEWYHIDCVGLSAVPEGRWYCDHCTGMSSQKKRKRGRPAAGSVSKKSKKSKKSNILELTDTEESTPSYSPSSSPSKTPSFSQSTQFSRIREKKSNKSSQMKSQ
ncbi:8472_t:CDS:2 [Funneliformis mosseae]|uniref:Chromatin modification-related protein n=1 Tax=Funneliformis mosseae TaxID=27381 RepID=A0A9N8V4B0_FUNMO|nr:8472_t:CDS:2 [Funneliformis mosseae]